MKYTASWNDTVTVEWWNRAGIIKLLVGQPKIGGFVFLYTPVDLKFGQ